MSKNLKKKDMFDALYISYDGLIEPLGQAQVIPYIKGLSGKGIKLIVLSFEKENLSAKDEVNKIKESLLLLGVKWIQLKYHKKPLVISTLFDIFCGIILGIFIVKKYCIKIIHCRSYVTTLIGICIQELLKIKIIFDMRGFWAEERVEAGIWRKNSCLYKIAKYFEKLFLLRADHIVTLTQKAKEEIISFEYLKNKRIDISNIPTCVDTNKFYYKNKNEQKKELNKKVIIVYSGSLSTWNMTDGMVDFIKTANEIFPDIKFMILSNEKDVAKILLNYKMSEGLYSCHNVPHDQIPEFLNKANAGLAFYKPGYSRMACCPTKLGEYLSCGIPVIINKSIGDCDDIIHEERVGVVLKEFNEEEYRKAAIKLMELLTRDNDLRKRCHLVANKYFSLSDGINNYFKIYNRFLLK